MALETLIYPGSSSFFPGQTPFGIYDNDYEFQEEAPKVALWCARRLGYPIQNIELLDENFYACLEEAVSEYGAQVNQFNIRNNLDVLRGKTKSTNLSNKLVQGSNLPTLIGISDAYGTLAGVGGNTDIKKGYVELQAGQQEYDLDTLWGAVSESGKRIEIVKDEFGFGSFSPAAQFILMPIFEDMLRIQAIEFNDQFRKSAFTFNIVNGKIRVFPRPTSQHINLYGKLYFDYFVKDDFTENSTNITPNVISDYSDIPYDFMEFGGINDVGKQWIRKYTLALVKELLGAVREKYSQIPIPGSEISLDGAALRAEATTEKESLMTQLRETLEELGRTKQFENRNTEATAHQEMLRKVPLAIYIG